VTDSSVVYRELRRSDVPSFIPVILQGMGAVEAATGMDVTSTQAVQVLRRPGMVGLVRILQLLRIAPIRILVGVERGQVVGTTTVVLFPNTGYIGGVATDAPSRGRGIGTHLMELAHSTTQKGGKPWLSLDVESENETAIRLYRRLGYTEAARFSWFIGPPPRSVPTEGPVPQEIRNSDKGIRDWVGQILPEKIRGPLPPTGRRLSSVEVFARPSRAPVKTWKLASGGRVQGVVRAFHSPKTHTGFVLPIGADPSLSDSGRATLIAPAIAWHVSLGATRIALPVLEPVESWTVVATNLGLLRTVGTTLMVRPTSP
jgi:GNAT superfamily N-acetyltransferase